ncbi:MULTISPECIES: DUF2948 family protein [Methylobacterium]|uniref:DUF2948 domain-containing protein n=2 Tax=Pseudomonadota TaxID=1224 RepID=A0ABQ4SPT7_9HYPH|nr:MULTISPECIES: DUF2948 family protein [Methylobacterium]PIU06209.1 MAG: DUF2948 domain-containing protein [Methylobacterium sp. CG09_land_8_20_14_0_10_71_15]PIU14500.1 MAG: DUF2948 domain-containing protein [Methylobacterium sp. CG08_land_8_20_14_0_20_71_15]GBU19319.1 hypothetical protein AwMethylo_35340 [Methylobacterium sp.]GJE05190.1 hypothetical protein AOPFMNJM_0487 [Methylobacterium jeotgali]
MELLRLAALDADDLTIVSAHLQDALLRTGDIVFLPAERRFVLSLRRFDWEAPAGAPPRRRLAGAHFERVLAARSRGLPADPDATLSLLSITFEPGEAPSGTAILTFAGGAVIALDLECVEMRLKDLGPVWEAESRPSHVPAPEPGAA